MVLTYIVYFYCALSGIFLAGRYILKAGPRSSSVFFKDFGTSGPDFYPVIIFLLLSFGWLVLPIFLFISHRDSKKELEEMPGSTANSPILK